MEKYSQIKNKLGDRKKGVIIYSKNHDSIYSKQELNFLMTKKHTTMPDILFSKKDEIDIEKWLKELCGLFEYLKISAFEIEDIDEIIFFETPDFIIKKCDNLIGLEITDCQPYSFYQGMKPMVIMPANVNIHNNKKNLEKHFSKIEIYKKNIEIFYKNNYKIYIHFFLNNFVYFYDTSINFVHNIALKYKIDNNLIFYRKR